jgi:ABC-type bacteriocin/lantibiotic exporter with double-glycine peptidase domain
MLKRVAILISVIVACGSSGCSWLVTVPPLEPLPSSRLVLSGVEYTPQQSDSDCGPACLTTVMRDLGSPLTLEEVTAQLKQVDGGTIIPEMIWGARKNGFAVTLLDDADINRMRKTLHQGKPLVLFLHPMPGFTRWAGLQRGHYVVAVGYDDPAAQAILHSGDRAFTRMSYRQLQLQWGRAGFIALLVERPPD